MKWKFYDNIIMRRFCIAWCSKLDFERARKLSFTPAPHLIVESIWGASAIANFTVPVSRSIRIPFACPFRAHEKLSLPPSRVSKVW